MILIVRTAQSTLETTNETVVLPLLPPLPGGRLRQDQPRRASLVVPIHYVREADVGEEQCYVRRTRPLHGRRLLLCRVNRIACLSLPQTLILVSNQPTYVSYCMQYALRSNFTSCIVRCWKTGINTNIHSPIDHINGNSATGWLNTASRTRCLLW